MRTPTLEHDSASLAEQAHPGTWLRFDKPIRLINGAEYRFGQMVGNDEVALVSEYELTRTIAGGGPKTQPEIGYVLGDRWAERYELAQVADTAAGFDLHIDTKELARAVERIHGPSGWSAYCENRRARVARGVPAGGQFTHRDRPEAVVAL